MNFTDRVLTTLANQTDDNGGTLIHKLPDGRWITLITIHEDPHPPTTPNTQ